MTTQGKVNKADLTRWAKRIREDLRDMMQAVQDGDLAFAHEMAMDAGAAGVMCQEIIGNALGIED